MLISKLLSATMIAGAHAPREDMRRDAAARRVRQADVEAARRESARRASAAPRVATSARRGHSSGAGANPVTRRSLPDYANYERFRV